MSKPIQRTITSPLIFSTANLHTKKHPLISGIMLPKWGGNLDFRHARAEEAGYLKMIYEAAWGNGITISEARIRAKISNFPEGQIIGVEKGRDTPVSMINIMLMLYDPAKGFEGGYEKVTGGRTFSTSIGPLKLYEALEQASSLLGIASCVSIATNPRFARSGYAFETLNYAIMFSLANGLVPAPYSAPRGFARARKKNPGLDIIGYLHMTKPAQMGWEAHFAKISAIIPRIAKAFRWQSVIDLKRFIKYQGYKADSMDAMPEETAYRRFMQDEGKSLSGAYGRALTIEDFCILTGRVLADPVIGMHVQNGARFIRDSQGEITAVFPDSRPEDPASLGYNIVLSYGYHQLFGHLF